MSTECQSDVSGLKRLLLELGEERCSARVPELIVQRLSGQPDYALVRIWLVQPGDVCDVCPMREECPDQTNCLHLVASAGRSRETDGPDWSSIDGRFRRFPLGVRKVGRIAATREAIEVPDVRADPTWIADRDWAEREGILAFGGQPLVFQGEVLGVLGIFTRACLGEEALSWLRMIADHAAAAIANARAFEEIERLRGQLELERDYLREEVQQARAFGEIIGRSAPMQKVAEQIDLVAPTDASVLVVGESGTGKELVAREIHRRSRRAEQALVRVNCAAVPRELYESEFFGHVKGSFTGAVSDRVGRFELADGGTLFLDEVGEIPVELQSKLLRVLQEGTYERVGDPTTRTVDVRIVAATNVDFEERIATGRFRSDLYYRLNVFPVTVAPLRERQGDVGLLAEHFVERASRDLNRPAPRLTKRNVAELERYDWPGNVRELQNVIERAVITARNGRLQFDLPTSSAAASPVPIGDVGSSESFLTESEFRRLERDNLVSVLRSAAWKVSGSGGAAELLGIKPTTLNSRMRKLEIRRPG